MVYIQIHRYAIEEGQVEPRNELYVILHNNASAIRYDKYLISNLHEFIMKKSNENELPGFTAEASLYKNKKSYVLTSGGEGSYVTIVPATVRPRLLPFPWPKTCLYCECWGAGGDYECDCWEVPCR
jgi:hypothetical protein